MSYFILKAKYGSFVDKMNKYRDANNFIPVDFVREINACLKEIEDYLGKNKSSEGQPTYKEWQELLKQYDDLIREIINYNAVYYYSDQIKPIFVDDPDILDKAKEGYTLIGYKGTNAQLASSFIEKIDHALYKPGEATTGASRGPGLYTTVDRNSAEDFAELEVVASAAQANRYLKTPKPTENYGIYVVNNIESVDLAKIDNDAVIFVNGSVLSFYIVKDREFIKGKSQEKLCESLFNYSESLLEAEFGGLAANEVKKIEDSKLPEGIIEHIDNRFNRHYVTECDNHEAEKSKYLKSDKAKQEFAILRIYAYDFFSMQGLTVGNQENLPADYVNYDYVQGIMDGGDNWEIKFNHSEVIFDALLATVSPSSDQGKILPYNTDFVPQPEIEEVNNASSKSVEVFTM